MIRAKMEAPTRGRVLGFVLVALFGASTVLGAVPALAGETFTVNSTFDSGDLSVGDGVCDALTSGGEQCTLRAAIQEANHPGNPGADFIGFNIGGGIGVKTISPRSELPGITEQLTINGYTQPGATENTETRPGKTNTKPLVELDGSNTGGGDGLDVRAANVVVRGLVINRFPFDGIDIRANGDGVEPTGVKIEGNFIGTDAAGQAALGNGAAGVLLFEARNNTIGGSTPDTRNLISGNAGDGVDIVLASGNKIEGNLIGTRRDGASGLGNTEDGVEVGNSDNNTIGGVSTGAANTIAFNNAEGVEILGSVTGNRILGNSIFSNAILGINLGDDGRTDNDEGDADLGPNSLQNFPVLTSARTDKVRTTVKGNLDSTPQKAFTVQFYANPPATDEGKVFLGKTSATTDVNGDASFSFRARKRASGVVTATATDPAGNTSEFSAPRKVVRRR